MFKMPNHAAARISEAMRFAFAIALTAFSLALLSGCRPKPSSPSIQPAQYQYDLGQKLLKGGDTSGAHAAFDTSIRLDAHFAPAYLAQAQLAAQTGDVTQAIQCLDTLHKASPTTPHVLCRLAQLHAISGHFEDGLNAAQIAIKEEPDCPLAKTEYALSMDAAGKTAEAMQMLTSVHQTSPQDERVTLILIQLLARAGKPAEAWKALKTLPAQPKLMVRTLYTSAWLLAEYGIDGKRDATSALALLDKALAISPADGPSNQEKGKLLLQRGDATAAQGCLQKAMNASGPSVELLKSIAETQALLNNPKAKSLQEAARAFAAMVDKLYAARQRYITDPDNRDNLVSLSRMEASLGNTQDAQEMLMQVLKRNANDQEVLKMLVPAPAGEPTSTH